MDRGVAECIRDLGEIQAAFPDELFCRFDLETGKIINDATAIVELEKFLELGPAEQVVMADFLDGQLPGDIRIHIFQNPLVGFLVQFGANTAWGRDSLIQRITAPVKLDQQMLQADSDHLLRAKALVWAAF